MKSNLMISPSTTVAGRRSSAAQKLGQGLLLLALFTSLTVRAQTPAPALPINEVVYMGDIEGQMSRLTTVLEGSGAFDHLSGLWHLKDGKKLVFSGDALDRGDGGREVLRILIDLKSRYPDRVVFTQGNRDISKLAVLSELAPENMQSSNPSFDKWMVEKNLDPAVHASNPITKLRWMLTAMYAKTAFEDTRKELIREGQPASDQNVFDAYVGALKSGGLFGTYIAGTQLADIDTATETLFVHGAVNKLNFGRVPSHPHARFKFAQDWVKALNQWGAQQVARGLAPAKPYENGAQDLIEWIYRDPKDHKNETSIVTARYFDENGVPGFPEPELIKTLKKQGIRRIAVGHTPTGEIPLIMVGHGFEIVMADQSFNTSGKSGSISITKDGVKMVSELPGFGLVHVDTTKGIPEHVGRLLPNGELVAGQLASGDIVLFKKDAKFQPIYRTVSPATVRQLLRPGICWGLFRS